MIDAPVLDTHAWIWWVDHDRRLGQAALDALDALPREGRPYLCDISLWEVATLPSTFHRDPVDRVIVATCRVLQAPLLTRDRLITRSRLVKRWTTAAVR